MNCQQCGNGVQPEELFCGQCGTATLSSPLPTSRVNSAALGSEDLSVPYKIVFSPPHAPSTQTPHQIQTKNLFSPSGGLFIAHQHSQETRGYHRGTVGGQQEPIGFYQDATEAMSLPSNEVMAGQVGDYPQQVLPSPLVQKDLSAMGQYRLPVRPATQSLHVDQSVVPCASHPSLVSSGQGYDYGRLIRPAIPPRSQKQQPGSMVLIVSICLVVVLISVAGIIALFLRGSSQSMATNKSASTTTMLQLQPAPTLIATPTSQTTPTPTPVPTPLPDQGFMWCDTTCTNYGFSVEYPVGWQLSGAQTNNGIQFTNPAQPDQTATFKAIGPTGGSAGDILNSELQTNFMTKSGYIPPQGTDVTTLGGETWVATTVYYQSTDGYNPSTDGYQQREHVTLYTIVYQSRGYVIEIQAPDPDGQQFTLVYNTDYAVMLSKFSFVQ